MHKLHAKNAETSGQRRLKTYFNFNFLGITGWFAEVTSTDYGLPV